MKKYEVFPPSHFEGVASTVLCEKCIAEPRTAVALANSGQRIETTSETEKCERCGQ